jgi:DNA-binding NtrC family response regulator
MKILVIEDDRDLLPAMQAWLETEGHCVVTAEDEATAERILKEEGNSFEIAIVDMRLPEKPGESSDEEVGIRLVSKMTKEFPNILSMVNTGFDDKNIIEQCVEAGAFNALIKTDDWEPLRQALRWAAATEKKIKEHVNRIETARKETQKHEERAKKVSSAFQKIVKDFDDIKGSIQRIQKELSFEEGTGK